MGRGKDKKKRIRRYWMIKLGFLFWSLGGGILVGLGALDIYLFAIIWIIMAIITMYSNEVV